MNRQTSRGRTVACALALLAVATAIQAKTIRINAEGTGDVPSLRAAVEAANSGDIIVLERGTYSGKDNTGITVAGKVLTLRGQDPNDPAVGARTIINWQASAYGSDYASNYALDVEADGKTLLTIAGLTIRNSSDSMFAGGAVRCQEAGLEAINCTFQNDAVESWADAVYCHNSHARFVGCTFSNNASQAMHCGGISCRNSQVDLENCSFEAHTGSALETWDCQVTLTNCTFQRNEGQDGGAVYCRADIDPVSTHLTVTRCTFTANSARASGGAIYNYGFRATVSACTFTMNTAGEDGGALYNFRSSPTVADCVFAGNTATGNGGAVQNLYDSSPDLINCTFVANGAAGGGAVASKGGCDPLLSHCILWNNTAAQGSGVYVGRYQWSSVPTATATIEYCDVQDNHEGVYAEADCQVRWEAGNVNVDPLFVGSRDGDYHLSYNSPCMDAGDPKYNPPAGETDRDGRARRIGSTVDLGAYECPGLGVVYRFWSPIKNKHFYTIHAAERDKLISKYPSIWRFEGEAYCAFYQAVDANLLPVHRFWSDKLSAHFWTISEEERQKTIKDHSDAWTYEGVAFYAYPQGRQPLGALPVYRFWSNRMGDHVYTMIEDEKNLLMRNYPQEWQFEGVAWYAYPTLSQPEKAIYEFTGGAQEASYVLSLGVFVDGKEAQLAVPDAKLSVSSTWMQMTIDFAGLSTTLDRLQVKTAMTDYSATIRQIGSGVTIPLSMSLQGTFDISTPQGPFTIDPTTGIFADFTKAGQNPTAKDPTAQYNGSVRLGDQTRSFDLQGAVSRFAPEGTGTFEELDQLPDKIDARMPFTLQWHRQFVQDLLAEASVGGHLVQIYVTSIYIGTQGVWEGKIAK